MYEKYAIKYLIYVIYILWIINYTFQLKMPPFHVHYPANVQLANKKIIF